MVITSKINVNYIDHVLFEIYICSSTAHTHAMETHSMEKVPSMENFQLTKQSST